jgi:hypothetical protein
MSLANHAPPHRGETFLAAFGTDEQRLRMRCYRVRPHSDAIHYQRQALVNVQKGSGTIWTLADELARLSNVQIVPDPFWTLTLDHAWGWMALWFLNSSPRS